MENKKTDGEEISSAKAVLIGALAPGVNNPTWSILKLSFLMLTACLAAMLGLAFSSTDSAIIIHVLFLLLIAVTLFLLLSRFIAETGFVSVEQQMEDLGLVPEECEEVSKKR